MSASARRASVVLASNRGPVSYTLGDDGRLQAGRGGGGLVAGLAGHQGSVWVCAALTDSDRLVAASGPGGRLDPEDTDGAAARVLAIHQSTSTRPYASAANSPPRFPP